MRASDASLIGLTTTSPATPPPPEPSGGTTGEAVGGGNEVGAEPKDVGPDPKDVAAAATTAAMGTAIATIDIKRMLELWPAVVDHVRESGSEMLSTLFDGARPIAIDSERSIVRVGFPSSAKFNKRKAEAKANVERITESVKIVVGERLRPVYELMDSEAEPAEPSSPAMAEEEIIDLIKTKFDASEVIAEERRDEEAG